MALGGAAQENLDVGHVGPGAAGVQQRIRSRQCRVAVIVVQQRLRVLPGLGLGSVRIVALYPSRRMLEPRVRRFIDFLGAELGRRR